MMFVFSVFAAAFETFPCRENIQVRTQRHTAVIVATTLTRLNQPVIARHRILWRQTTTGWYSTDIIHGLTAIHSKTTSYRRMKIDCRYPTSSHVYALTIITNMPVLLFWSDRVNKRKKGSMYMHDYYKLQLLWSSCMFVQVNCHGSVPPSSTSTPTPS